MSGKPQPGAKRPLCASCRRQRRCYEAFDGRRLCADCITELTIALGCTTAKLTDRQAALMRTLFDRARDGATHERGD